MIRAIRGAVTAKKDERSSVFEAVQELIRTIQEENSIDTSDMADMIFTVTPDIRSVFPAAAVRDMGITDVPLLDMAAPDVEGALRMCIRVMIHINTEKSNSELKHVYLGAAAALRPDIAGKN